MTASVGPRLASTVGECVATSLAAPAGRRGKRTPNSAPAAHAQRGKLRVRSRARLYPTGLANHGGARRALTAAAVFAETLAEQPGNMGSSISSRSLPSAGGGGRGVFPKPFWLPVARPSAFPVFPPTPELNFHRDASCVTVIIGHLSAPQGPTAHGHVNCVCACVRCAHASGDKVCTRSPEGTRRQSSG